MSKNILLLSVIALKIVSKPSEEKSDIALVENLAHDFGLDSALNTAFEKFESAEGAAFKKPTNAENASEAQK